MDKKPVTESDDRSGHDADDFEVKFNLGSVQCRVVPESRMQERLASQDGAPDEVTAVDPVD